MLDERPDPWLVERHEREIFPLLHRRAWFAEAADFLLYDFVTDGGGVDEDVLAYSNGCGPAALAGRLPHPVRVDGGLGSATPRRTRARRRRLEAARRGGRWPTAWGCPHDPAASSPSATRGPGSNTCARAASSGSAAWRVARRLRSHVFWEFREVRDGVAGQWARLAARLGGRGVPSLDEALRELQLEPVHAPLRALFADGRVRRRSTATVDRVDGCDELERGRGVPGGGDRRDAVPGRASSREPSARSGARRGARGAASTDRRLGRTRPPPTGGRRRCSRLGVALGRTGADDGRDEPRLVRRAAAAPGARGRVARAGLDEGEAGPSPTTSGCSSPCRGRHSSAGAARPRARLLEAWLAGDDRSGSPSGSTPGRASSTSIATGSRRRSRWAVRLDAIEADEAAPTRRPPCVAADRGRGGGRLPGRPRSRELAPPRRRRSGAKRRRTARRAAPPRAKPPDARAAEGRGDEARLTASRTGSAAGATSAGVPWARSPTRGAAGSRSPASRRTRRRRAARAPRRRRADRPTRPRRGGAPRARCPTSPSSPRSRSTAGSTTAAPGRTWRAPRPPPGTRRRPSG